ncbi:MAG: hypothetical protein HPY65_16895 [Syntrophaceae bacterium]|nr:hypothetical protein [Syntrophaceae bacterium]
MASSIISFSYLANVLARRHRASITAFLLKEKNSRSWLTDRGLFRLYRSFNADRFVYVHLSSSQMEDRDRLFESLYPMLKTKRDVEDLQADGVWFGDLLYDSYLMACRKPTIDLEDEDFRHALRDALGYHVFWRDYLATGRVKAVILSHCVYYEYAVLLRHAVQRDIPVYQSNASHVYHLSRERLWAYDDFYDYPERFAMLSAEEQERGLWMAEERLQRRFSGEVGVDMHYSTMSAYTRPNGQRIIPESPRIKILIATHCFFDSPHPYGVNLFPDFYEWLVFLGNISERTDYDWYIKTHPDFLPGNKEILGELIRRYPKFTLIPSDSSHLQLIQEGINFALTVYGTIGFEYAALGVPVIHASLCNPQIRYGFNIHPRTVQEYENILLNLHDQKLDIDIRQVLEYYYMAFLHNSDDWLFPDFRRFLQEVGGYYGQMGPESYRAFMESFTPERHKRIFEGLDEFVSSGEYRFHYSGNGELQ